MVKAKENKVTFKGKKVSLNYSFYSIIKLEEIGIKVTELGEEVGFTELTSLLWAGLLHLDNQLTVEEVQQDFQITQVKEVSNAIRDAINPEK